MASVSRPYGGSAPAADAAGLENLPSLLSWPLALVRTYPVAAAAVVAGVVSRVVFWVLTDRRFEDALITVTHARNGADGIGLTHHPGEPHTHGFTSAISVLVPLVGEALHDGGGFFALRIASLIAFVVAIVCAAAIGRRLGVSQWLMVFPLAYLAIDQNQIFYGMAGMETQIATAVLLTGVYSLMTERLVVTGALLGLALLVRPDFVLWVVPALILLAFRCRRRAVGPAIVTVGVVMPWLAFTTLYYGSPVPNTIRAKSAQYPTEFPSLTDPIEWVSYSWRRVSQLEALWHAWTPFLENGFVVRVAVDAAVLACVAIAFIALAIVGAWRARGNGAWLVAVAYGALFVLYRVYFLPPQYYEWYMGPFMAVAVLAAAAGLASVARLLPAAAIVGSCALAIAFAMHLPMTFVLEQRVQRQIEDRVRVPMAQYVGRVVQPGERVVSESAGYVGYYAGVTLYDYPGLTSRGALDALYRLGSGRHSLAELANAARPEWLVMRPGEWKTFEREFPRTAAQYALDRKFEVTPEESALLYRGVEYSNVDRVFLVLRRARSASPAEA